ncbi:aminotransferase class I/II-fold pyridoxal phosphate-dependent enzyme, partial [Mycolicibacterium diernhoferi]|uniref:aminotransferase class I/II-fold pyridoxal phosphate-dependent enzyme n=1 Tax=Mycolicibacterium diernhoferi TaxID=1801 RepID=UPI001056085E
MSLPDGPAGLRDALPAAIDPLALSLNENPFPPLPSVRAALVDCLGAANRYPEFLPERMRALIAARIGVRDDQVVIGTGATGVILQVLHALTAPGDTMVMTAPTFDGYPIFAQMARLRSVTVPLDVHGRHDLDAMAAAALGARLRQLGVPAIVVDKHERPGDQWRKRYKSLCLHDPVWYD